MHRRHPGSKFKDTYLDLQVALLGSLGGMLAYRCAPRRRSACRAPETVLIFAASCRNVRRAGWGLTTLTAIEVNIRHDRCGDLIPHAPAVSSRWLDAFGLVRHRRSALGMFYFDAWRRASLSRFNLFAIGRSLAIDIVIGFSQMVVLATGGMNLAVGVDRRLRR